MPFFFLKRILIVFLLGVMTACSFQVDVLEPQSTASALPASPSAVPLSTSTPSVLTATSTATTSPTSTPSPLPPVTSGPSSASGIIPIAFDSNATSQTILGDLAAGASQTYSLNAFEGQVMSVSILPEKSELQNSYQLEIRGRDGSVLCPIKDYTCFFWRGALPSTQEYRIKVLAQAGGAFRMRVAINPPGTVSQTFSYADPEARFSLSYPDTFAPVHFNAAGSTKIPPDFSLQDIDTQQFTSTNLNEVYFLVGVSDDPQVVAACTQPISFGGPENVLGEATVNNITFTKSEATGVGAGNVYEQVYYRTLYDGSCYEVTYFVHYGNIGNYTPGTVSEFDRTALYQQLDEILASLILK